MRDLTLNTEQLILVYGIGDGIVDFGALARLVKS